MYSIRKERANREIETDGNLVRRHADHGLVGWLDGLVAWLAEKEEGSQIVDEEENLVLGNDSNKLAGQQLTDAK
jgi:hypothetical protein